MAQVAHQLSITHACRVLTPPAVSTLAKICRPKFVDPYRHFQPEDHGVVFPLSRVFAYSIPYRKSGFRDNKHQAVSGYMKSNGKQLLYPISVRFDETVWLGRYQ